MYLKNFPSSNIFKKIMYSNFESPLTFFQHSNLRFRALKKNK